MPGGGDNAAAAPHGVEESTPSSHELARPPSLPQDLVQPGSPLTQTRGGQKPSRYLPDRIRVSSGVGGGVSPLRLFLLPLGGGTPRGCKRMSTYYRRRRRHRHRRQGSIQEGKKPAAIAKTIAPPPLSAPPRSPRLARPPAIPFLPPPPPLTPPSFPLHPSFPPFCISSRLSECLLCLILVSLGSVSSCSVLTPAIRFETTKEHHWLHLQS